MLKGFIERMLVRNPVQRATALELLEQPFLKKAAKNGSIFPVFAPE